jgi:hypothetical protein
MTSTFQNSKPVCATLQLKNLSAETFEGASYISYILKNSSAT